MFSLFRKKPRGEVDRREVIRLLPSWEGQFCIYWEGESIAYGTVEGVSHDGEGIELRLRFRPAAGMILEEDEEEERVLFSRWEDLSAGEEHIFTYFGGWHLFFRPELVGRLRETAQVVADLPPDRRFLKLMDIILQFMEV